MLKKFDDEFETQLFFEEIIASTHNDNVKIWKVSENSKYFALKSILRKFIDTDEKMTHLYNERNSLREFSHPGIIKLIKTLKDPEYLYLLLEICYGITLDKLLQMTQKFSQNFTKLIAAQLVLILEYIHSAGYIYRDLKLSNLVIDGKGKIKLLDFGFCKKLGIEKTNSFCGTVHAMAPEFFDEPIKGYSYEVDYYAFGVLLYEMTMGYPPFGYENKNPDIIKEIKTGISTELFKEIHDVDLVDILQKLLEKDAEKRFGPQVGWKTIKNHDYFKKINWDYFDKFIRGDADINKFYKNNDLDNYKDDIEQGGLMQKKDLSETEKKAEMIFNDLFLKF